MFLKNRPSSVTNESSSIQSSSASNSTNNDLASLFECPVCFDYVLPPILQCQSGHLVCANCRPKLTCCPTCRGPLGNIRNLGMEKVSWLFCNKQLKVIICFKTFLVYKLNFQYLFQLDWYVIYFNHI